MHVCSPLSSELMSIHWALELMCNKNWHSILSLLCRRIECTDPFTSKSTMAIVLLSEEHFFHESNSGQFLLQRMKFTCFTNVKWWTETIIQNKKKNRNQFDYLDWFQFNSIQFWLFCNQALLCYWWIDSFSFLRISKNFQLVLKNSIKIKFLNSLAW